MTDQWIEGEPDADGLYACVCDFGRGIVVLRTLRRCDGAMYHAKGKYGEQRENECKSTILRHYRISEPSKPLELPRRFRAKYKGQEVVGAVYQNNSGQRYFVTSPGDLYGCYTESMLTDLTWEPER